MKVIRDSLHGDIEFYPEEMRLLHTAGFERLHGCRQLGLTHLVYPAAKHSRFEHVLGVMHVASQIAEGIQHQGYFFLGKEGERLIRVLRLAALLHDMGHVPFGHTLEDEMPIIPKHDEPSVGNAVSRMEKAVSDVLHDSGNDEYREPVLQVLLAIDVSKDDDKLSKLIEQKKINPDFLVLADIIGNTICADLLDYIKRDHMMTGIHATYDNRIFRYFGVGQYKGFKRVVLHLVRHGRVRNDALADLLDILKLRYNLSDKVLFHPKKCSADAMLIRAVSEAGLTEADLMRFSDDGLLDSLTEQPLIQMIRRWSLFKPVFVCGLGNIATYDETNSKEDLIRKLHKDAALRTRIEKRIEEEVGLPKGETSVLIFCPAPYMTLKPVRALVQWKDGTIRRLNEIKEADDPVTVDQITLLQRIYPQLWKLYLFVHPKLRKRGHSIREKFCDILDEDADLSVTCDPAFQHYLELSIMAYTATEDLTDEIKDSCISTAKSLTSEVNWVGPPFPLKPLLDKLDISEVRERPLNGDARLVYRDGYLVIEVNPLFPTNRRRLSVAHELGHLILNRCAGRDVLCADHSDPVSERLCDRVAGELLAPEWAVRRFFESTPALAPWQESVRCSTLLRAARAFGMSVDAMACRVFHVLALAPKTLAVVWRFSRNPSRAESEPALRISSAWHSMPNRFIPLNKTAPGDSVAARAFREEGFFTSQEEMCLGGLKGRFLVEAGGFGGQASHPTSRGVLSLITSAN